MNRYQEGQENSDVLDEILLPGKQPNLDRTVVLDSAGSNLRQELEQTPDVKEFQLNRSLRESDQKAGTRLTQTQAKPSSAVPYTQINLAKGPMEKALDLFQKAEILS